MESTFGSDYGESIYKVIILDLGDTVDGLYDLLGRCSKIYTPYIEEGAAKANSISTKRILDQQDMARFLRRR